MAETQEYHDRLKLKREFYQRTQSAPTVIEGESHEVAQNSDLNTFDTIDSFLRLILGGAFELTDVLIDQLRQWEETAATDQEKLPVAGDETVAVLMRYVLVGLIFDTQHRVRRGVSSAGGMLSTITGAAAAVARPITSSRVMAPARRRAGLLSDRALDELIRLIQVGRREELIGRLSSRDVAEGIINELLAYMAANPEVAQLVQQQGTGMAAQLVGAVRERTVTTDNLLEGIFRKILQKKPRSELSGAPDIVKMQAVNRGEIEASES